MKKCEVKFEMKVFLKFVLRKFGFKQLQDW